MLLSFLALICAMFSISYLHGVARMKFGCDSDAIRMQFWMQFGCNSDAILDAIRMQFGCNLDAIWMNFVPTAAPCSSRVVALPALGPGGSNISSPLLPNLKQRGKTDEG